MAFLLNCHSQLPFRYTQNLATNYTQQIVPIWIDQNFSNQDRIYIDDAINEWNYALNQSIILKVVSYTFDMEPEIIKQAIYKRGWMILKIPSDSYLIDGPTTLAFANEIGGNRIFVIRARIREEDLKMIMMHEIGHVLGARHQAGQTLMFPSFNRQSYSCIDYQTIKQVAEFNHLYIRILNYCVYIR